MVTPELLRPRQRPAPRRQCSPFDIDTFTSVTPDVVVNTVAGAALSVAHRPKLDDIFPDEGHYLLFRRRAASTPIGPTVSHRIMKASVSWRHGVAARNAARNTPTIAHTW